VWPAASSVARNAYATGHICQQGSEPRHRFWTFVTGRATWQRDLNIIDHYRSQQPDGSSPPITLALSIALSAAPDRRDVHPIADAIGDCRRCCLLVSSTFGA